MPTYNILFINGVPDNRKIEVFSILENGTMFTSLLVEGSISKFAEDSTIRPVIVNLDTTRDQKLVDKTDIHAIFNQISDADSHRITLDKANILYKQFAHYIPFFNSPSKVMETGRDTVYQKLKDIDKLYVPKTIKLQATSPENIYEEMEKEGLQFPVILHEAGKQGNAFLLKDNSEQFHAFKLDGRAYYITEFIDCALDGIYRKLRLIIVEGEVFLRYALYGREAILYPKNCLPDEECKTDAEDLAKRFTKEIKPLIQPIITQIYERIGLDYFGLDCHIDETMNLVLFDLNTHIAVVSETAPEVFSENAAMEYQALVKMFTKTRSNTKEEK